LSRGGAKKRPFYHIVVTDQRNRRDGRYIERLGFFNPVAEGREEKLRVDISRVDYWVGHGAQPSERVTSLLKAYRKGAGNEGGGDSEKAEAKVEVESKEAEAASE
jgi:small subunit ribosomal protein S16